MRKLNLDAPPARLFATSRDGARFLLLGEEDPATPLSRPARDKLRRARRSAAPTLWGTLGTADGSPPIWKGVIAFSRRGSRHSTATRSYDATMEEIRQVRQGRPAALNTDRRRGPVLERFISFADVTFPGFPATFTPEEIPRLRLTLMLEPDEGALVFYQHCPAGRRRVARGRRGERSDGSGVEYLQPQPTHGHDCSGRDRLDYLIPILPPRRLQAADARGSSFRLNGRKLREPFVLKVLIFKRENSESGTILSRLGYHLQGHSHQLLLWDRERGAFEPRDGSALRSDARTLFLVHGTLSETTLAFRGLIDGGPRSWIGRRAGTGRGQYPQNHRL